MHKPRCFGWAAALLVCACGAGRDDDADDVQCDVTRAPLQDTDGILDLGFTASDVLAWAIRSERVEARWGQPQGIASNAGVGTAELSYSLTRANGSAMSVVDACESNLVEVPVQLEVATADGMLDEMLPGILRASRREFANITVEVPLADARGGIELSPQSPDLRIVSPKLLFAVTADGSAGAFYATVERRTATSIEVGPGSATFLTWPADSACERGSVPRSIDHLKAGWTDAVHDVADRSLRGRSSAGSYAVELKVGADSCVSADLSTTIPATLELREESSDRRLELAGAFSSAGEGASFRLSPTRSWGGSPQDFATRFGSFELDLRQYEHVELRAEFEVGKGSGAGAVTVVGYSSTCKPRCDANGCSGCGPLNEESLLEITIEPSS